MEAIFLSNGTGQDRKAFHHASAEPQSLFGSEFSEGDRYATLPPNLIMYHVPCPPKGAVPPRFHRIISLIQCSVLAKLWYSRSCRKTPARGEEGRGVSFPESIKNDVFGFRASIVRCSAVEKYVTFSFTNVENPRPGVGSNLSCLQLKN